jgi:AraC family transcriptional activator FtrA
MPACVALKPPDGYHGLMSASRSTRRGFSKGHVVAAIAYDGLCTFEFGIVVELFGLPRPELERWYDFIVCSVDPGPLRATGGIRVTPGGDLRALRRADTIVVPGWRDPEERPPGALLDALVRAHARGARIVSICSGVFVLAAAGLLNGRRATTHWRFVSSLARQYPLVRIDPDVLYVDEGSIMTSAGSAAGIDLGLHIIRKDFGAAIVNQVARRLVMPPHREGGQAQYVPQPVGDEDRPWLAHLFEWAQRRLNEPLDIERLAVQAHMSKRTLSRRFTEATGSSPGDWIVRLRIARAKDLLETTARSIERIASDCGFGSVETLRHHFRERMSTSPSSYRARFRRKSVAAGGKRPTSQRRRLTRV